MCFEEVKKPSPKSSQLKNFNLAPKIFTHSEIEGTAEGLKKRK